MIVSILKNRGSNGAAVLQRMLAAQLPCNVTSGTSDSVKSTRGSRFVIPWGVPAVPQRWRQRAIAYSSPVSAVAACRDKRATFDLLDRGNVPTLEWEDIRGDTINHWLATDGKLVVRATATGQSGAGISIVRRGEAIPNAPLYTRYFRKQAEYRAHVAFGRVIHIQQKRRRNGAEQDDEQALIRTHDNGYVFACNDLSCDSRNYRQSLIDVAVNAASAVGAVHCAVDLLVSHEQNNRVLVCEINSSPGLEAESTQNAWANAFVTHIRTLL